jgi:hypothetical protein
MAARCASVHDDRAARPLGQDAGRNPTVAAFDRGARSTGLVPRLSAGLPFGATPRGCAVRVDDAVVDESGSAVVVDEDGPSSRASCSTSPWTVFARRTSRMCVNAPRAPAALPRRTPAHDVARGWSGLVGWLAAERSDHVLPRPPCGRGLAVFLPAPTAAHDRDIATDDSHPPMPRRYSQVAPERWRPHATRVLPSGAGGNRLLRDARSVRDKVASGMRAARGVPPPVGHAVRSRTRRSPANGHFDRRKSAPWPDRSPTGHRRA